MMSTTTVLPPGIGIGGLDVHHKNSCRRAMGLRELDVRNKNSCRRVMGIGGLTVDNKNYRRRAMGIGGFGVHNCWEWWDIRKSDRQMDRGAQTDETLHTTSSEERKRVERSK